MYLLKRRLRARLGRLKFRKSVSHIDSLGCSIEELKIYLESLFYGNMNWNNYGKIWEIDHKEPLVKANSKSELITLCHYSNLKPLLIQDHIVKSLEDLRKRKYVY